MRPLDLADRCLILLCGLRERAELQRQPLDFHPERSDMVILGTEGSTEVVHRRLELASTLAGLAESIPELLDFILKLTDALLCPNRSGGKLVEIGRTGHCRRAVDTETKGRFGHGLFSLVREKRIEQARGERTLRDLLLGLCLLFNLRRYDFAALDVEREDRVELPLFEDEAAKPSPFCDCDEAKGVGPVAVPGALRVEFLKPEPDLLAGSRDNELLTLVLIDDELTEPVDQPFVKDARRAAFASTWSRMILNRV